MIDLTQFNTWAEAATWLAKHGYGMGSIELIKQEWDNKNTVEVPVEVVAPVSVEPETVSVLVQAEPTIEIEPAVEDELVTNDIVDIELEE
jgi:hypothetical protein